MKVGLELFVQAGPEVVAQLREQGLRVFLDLKFHDIPATMAGACRRAAALGAELITVHACAGSLKPQGAQAAAVEGRKLLVRLAVTVLTRRGAIAQGIAERVPALAQLSATAGIEWLCLFPFGGCGLAGRPDPSRW